MWCRVGLIEYDYSRIDTDMIRHDMICLRLVEVSLVEFDFYSM